jgi:acyl carrier protein
MTTFETVRKIIVEQLEIDEGEVHPGSVFANSFKMDYLDLMEVIICVEQTFGIEGSENEVDKIVTVQDLVDYIDACLKDKK